MPNGAEELQNRGVQELVPRPDPTSLTTLQLDREIANLKAIIESRLNGMDAATELLGRTVNRWPTDVDKQVSNLRELQEEKVRSLEQIIVLRFNDNAEAVRAAFASQKQAVEQQNRAISESSDKSEKGFTKQIDQLTLLIETRAKASDDKIDDIKDQLSRTRGVGQGAQAAQGEFRDQRQNNQWVIATIISVIAVILTLGFLAYGLAHSGASTTAPGVTVIAPTAVPTVGATVAP